MPDIIALRVIGPVSFYHLQGFLVLEEPGNCLLMKLVGYLNYRQIQVLVHRITRESLYETSIYLQEVYGQRFEIIK